MSVGFELEGPRSEFIMSTNDWYCCTDLALGERYTVSTSRAGKPSFMHQAKPMSLRIGYPSRSNLFQDCLIKTATPLPWPSPISLQVYWSERNGTSCVLWQNISCRQIILAFIIVGSALRFRMFEGRLSMFRDTTFRVDG